MKPSPLQIEHYFVTDLHFSANAAFDLAQTVVVNDDQFVVGAVSLRDKTFQDKWQITLRVSYQPAPGVNSPCSFSLEMIGLFAVAAAVPEASKELLAKTNGSSILYAIAREVVRSITTSGPQKGILLPATSFVEPVQPPTPPAEPTRGAAPLPEQATPKT